MNVKLRHYAGPKDLITAVDLAIEHELFVHGWYFSRYYYIVRQCAEDLFRWDAEYWQRGYEIALAFADGKPVAIAAMERARIMAFCKESHRRQGFATACVQRLMPIASQFPDLNAGLGIDGSELFWTSNGIVINTEY
jgi:RimJ/RimL family protein N-acetyltransferase